MLKPEQVPLDVVLALAHRLDLVGTAWEWREHIAAAINAWPGMDADAWPTCPPSSSPLRRATMTSDPRAALREKVAQAIADHVGGDACADWFDGFADAAIDVALEEAAWLCDHYALAETTEAGKHAGLRLAAAIRALKGED